MAPVHQGRYSHGECRNPDDTEWRRSRRHRDGRDVHQVVLPVTHDDQEPEERDAGQGVDGTDSCERKQ